MDSLCSFIWPPSGMFILLILPPGGRSGGQLIIRDQVSERIASGEKLIIRDQVSERKAYAPFSLRAVSLCFSFCLRAGS